MPPFDWSPYFGAYTVTDLLTAAAVGLAFVAPLVVFRLSYKWAIDMVGRVVKLVGL